MKKSLFFVAAASALMLTACSSESDVVQSATPSQTAAQNQAVGFEVYTPAPTNVTRSGQAGTMTTSRLQRDSEKGGGFGVYAYLVEDNNTAATADDYVNWQNRTTPSKAPNFMVNQLVEWNSTNQGWAYDPLKYWPNETDNDSQKSPAEMEGITGNKHLDRLTFFAYAPYVEADNSAIGVTTLTDKNGKLGGTGDIIEASVGYKAALDAPSSSVDLLWGVAPSGGLNYTAVNGQTVKVNEGEPLIDMTKPNVNTSMKFLFNHALARIGVNVVAAIDQIGAGGTLDPKTRITIEEVTLTGKFGETGILNLDNPTAKIAHWVDINGTTINGETTELTENRTLTLNRDNQTIAPDLRYIGSHTSGSYSEQTVTGVTTSKKDLIAPRYFKLDAVPAYDPAKKYYSDESGTEKLAQHAATAEQLLYAPSGNNYSLQTGLINAPACPNTMTNYYQITELAEFDGNHEITYTAEEAKTANAGLTGALSAGTLTVVQAKAYNAKLTGAVAAGSTVPADYAAKVGDPAAGETLTADEADLYNAQLDGAVAIDGTGSINADQAAAYNATLDGAVSEGDHKDWGYPLTTLYTGQKLYTKDASGYTYVGKRGNVSWGAENTNKYYRLSATQLAVTNEIFDFKYIGDTYDTERNYFMVIPTNNVFQLNSGIGSTVEKALRTIRVKIVYYVTTEDDKIAGGRTQIKNVIEKDVEFPSLANGKSYMLNLVLGLTSVKMDAEVDEWRVTNVNADLPQNTDN